MASFEINLFEVGQIKEVKSVKKLRESFLVENSSKNRKKENTAHENHVKCCRDVGHQNCLNLNSESTRIKY